MSCIIRYRSITKAQDDMTPDKMLMVRLPDEMHKRLRVRAAELGVPMSEIVRELIDVWLDEQISLPVQSEGREV